MERLRVVVVGAGMGGLTAALALRQAGHDVEIFDRVPALTAAGAGVSLWSNGVKVLGRLGLGAQLAAVGGRMERMCYRSKGGELLTDFSLAPLVSAVGESPYPVTRTDLQRLLLDALGADVVQLGAECVALEQDDSGATACFANGRRARGDLVVAADGTHSQLRSFVLGHAAARRYVGYVNWNGLVPWASDLPAPDTWTTFVGDHKRVSLMPVGGGRFYFFFDVPLPEGAPADTPERELARHFSGWAEPVQALIRSLEPQRTNRIPIHDIDPLPKLVRGRVALLGDAAHSSAPDLGQGGCQAMEDGWVLAEQLSHSPRGVVDALLRYERARHGRTSEIVLRARKRSDVTHGIHPEQTAAWYSELASEDGQNIISGIVKTIRGGPL